MNWDTEFRILGFDFDNKLMKLRVNYLTINKIVESLINRWRLYNRGVHGRVIIAKSMLLSQYTYLGMIMDILVVEDYQHIQNLLNNFKLYNEVYRKEIKMRKP